MYKRHWALNPFFLLLFSLSCFVQLQVALVALVEVEYIGIAAYPFSITK